MGGFGSGSWQSGRVTVEASPYLDLNLLRRQGVLVPGRKTDGTFRWSNWYETVRADYTATLGPENGHVVLRITDEADQWISLTSTPAPFGGRRWWWTCPSRGIRVCRLYRPPGGRCFASRRAWRLAYASTRQQPYERALHRAQALRERLGGDPSLDARPPPKPPGMHWSTYEQHLADLKQLEDIAEAHLVGLLAALGDHDWLTRGAP